MNQVIKAPVTAIEKSLILKQLSSGNLVIFPTDTLYAILADAKSFQAVEKVFAAKARDANKAIPVFTSSYDQASEYFMFNKTAKALAKKFWPGPLTLILENKGKLAPNISQFQTVAVRVPQHADLLEIITLFGGPLTGTSANLSGSENCFDINQMSSIFCNIDIIVEGGIQSGALPSTIIDCSVEPPAVLRMGSIAAMRS